MPDYYKFHTYRQVNFIVNKLKIRLRLYRISAIQNAVEIKT